MIYFFCVALALLVLAVPKEFAAPGGYRTRLAFIPVEGATSNYFDCIAKASDGSMWKSVDGIWVKEVV